MPTYRWMNTVNDREVEVTRRLTEWDLPPQSDRDECAAHETTWERVMTPVNFSLAGCGWASDGYATTSRGKVGRLSKKGS